MYQKYCESEGGMPVVASASVVDEALVEASRLVVRVLGGRPHLRDGIIARRGYVVLLDELQQLQDLPEYRDLQPDAAHWAPLRGLGATPESPSTVGSEEDVMCWDRGQHLESEQHSTLLHELAHTVHLLGLADTTRPGREVPFAEELRSAYEQAIQAGLWCYRAASKLGRRTFCRHLPDGARRGRGPSALRSVAHAHMNAMA
jgi:hypothetical protein